MFKMATLLLQGGQAFKMANVQACQRMTTLKAQNPYMVKVAILTTLKSADTAIRAARAATCVTLTIFTARKKAQREGPEGLRAPCS
jgi:hypothetical protein